LTKPLLHSSKTTILNHPSSTQTNKKP